MSPRLDAGSSLAHNGAGPGGLRSWAPRQGSVAQHSGFPINDQPDGKGSESSGF
jgi:hypothetical protein